MKLHLPSPLVSLLAFQVLGSDAFEIIPRWNLGLSSLLDPFKTHARHFGKREGAFETDPNGTNFLWVIQDTYQGETFFDTFDFYTGSDPTHGTVNYVNASYAFGNGLAYVQPNGQVIMQGDNTTWLPAGAYRDSVRISSQAQYNTGLFILDLNRAPWGCGVWPAFWTVGGGQWPYTGEIDVIEGVHANEHNQVTWHTAPGCTASPNTSYTGTLVGTDCDGTLPGNAGCGITEWSKSSYGPYFDSLGGGVFAMKWDETGIAVWSFYRVAVPQDIVDGSPDPSGWGIPDAALSPDHCDPLTYFVNHSIIFDITFCGDWAGNSYDTSGCPGTCSNQIMDPNNFVNASWIINYLKVYRKQDLVARVSGTQDLHELRIMTWASLALAIVSVALISS